MKKILLWGTGKLAKKFIDNQYNGEIIGFIETNKTRNIFMQMPVYESHEIPKEFDYIIVANAYGIEIYTLCLRQGIDISKLIFLYSFHNKQIGCTEKSIIKEILAEKNYTDYCIEFDFKDETLLDTDIEEYQRLNKRKNFAVLQQYLWPVIKDKYAYAGAVSNYFWQDLWAARLIHRSGVIKHFDIGSRIDGFIGHLLAMDIDVSIIDIREFPAEIENLHTIVDDATNLRQLADDSIDSMSALCSLEHFGLGRYGDPIDPEACFKCFDNIQKKLRKGGKLYISLPIGKERLEFNAHRVFYPCTIIECFSAMKLIEFSCAANDGIEYNADIHKYDTDPHNGEWRYGLFYFVKQ